MSLSDFLLARIAEDEVRARDCCDWSECQPGDGCPAHPSLARSLAECEARVRIVKWCSQREMIWVGTIADDREHPRPENFAPGASRNLADAVVLRFLALPYADHPDYRQEWKP